jgi:hypothetical protein
VATVLYPTRAGDSAYRNQDRAMALAQELGARLLLLYVSNVSFLDHTAAPVHLEVIEQELDELGQFLLAMAQERAEKAGIQADTVIQHGGFRQALKDVIQEHEVVAVVLGLPSRDTAITTSEYIRNLARSLSAELGVEAFVVHEGDVVEHYQAEQDADKANAVTS